jgi:HEAT repeat protein
VRWSSAEVLGEIGTEAAVSALVKALNDQEPEVRYYAARALGKIGTEAAVPGLVQALNDESFQVRSDAAKALGKISSQEAAPELLKALDDATTGGTGVVYSIAEALQKIAPPELMPTFSEILLTTSNRFLLWAKLGIIVAIQERCGYYNHAIATRNG